MADNHPTGSATFRPARPVLRAYGNAAPPANPSMSITLPPGMTAALENLIAETGKPIGEIVAGALGLYVLALKAHQEGKAVGVAPTPDALETVFVGL